MKKNGANQERGQAKNRELVLRTLQHMKICSRAELAKQTGLKQATITYIINDFLSWGLVEETGLLVGNKGRRSIGVKLAETKYRVIGFQLTRQHYSIGIFSLSGNEISRSVYTFKNNTSPLLLLEEVCSKINEIIHLAKDEVYMAVGAAVPGPYYSDTGEVAVISDFPGWKNIKIRDILQEKIPIPVVVVHDANAGVLAETYLFDKCSIYDTIIYISAGRGIGAGILHNGVIFTGTMGVAGEIGHTCINIHGPKCDCGGNGCLELYASTKALINHFQVSYKNENMTYQEVIRLITSHDSKALEIFDEFMKYFSIVIVNTVYNFNPKLIIIGDEISEIGPLLIEKLKNTLQMNDFRFINQVEIQQAKLGYDSAFYGSAILASHFVFENISSFFNS